MATTADSATKMAWTSDALAALLRDMDFKYVALNPGASYRGLHDSLVNYLGNERPQMLLCLHEESAVAIAQRMHKPRFAASWTEAALRLGRAVAASGGFGGQPTSGVFAEKDRYSMDWYYPVLGTALRGAAALERIDAGWERFVVPGLGTRCVDDRPWVTGGETFELCIALWAVGREDRARRLLTGR